MSSKKGNEGSDDETDDGIDSSTDLPSLTPSVRAFIRADRKNKCELCDADGDTDDTNLEIHHRKPKSEGGTDHPHNLILICRECHQRHHGTLPADQMVVQKQIMSQSSGQGTDVDSESDEALNDAPLPPRSKPNETDGEILGIIETQGPVRTGVVAEQVGCSKQYIRRQCWKLSGEQLIAPTKNDTWELRERANEDEITIGLPEDPERAKRAGRDEVIRRLSAHGMPHTEIAEIAGLSRSTVDIAVDRARALQIEDDEEGSVDLTTIAMRVSALLDVIDHAQNGR